MINTPTEIDLVVGSMITIRPDEDRQTYQEEYHSVIGVQQQLQAYGVMFDLIAQPGAALWEGGIDSLGSLYQLSRIATHLENNHDITSILDDGPVLDFELDPTVTDVWNKQATTRFPHLVNLMGINSYYLPTDFEQPIWLPFENEFGEEDPAFFGSSVRLQQELTELQERMQQSKIPSKSAAYQCLCTLREAAEQSLYYQMPILIW